MLFVVATKGQPPPLVPDVPNPPPYTNELHMKMNVRYASRQPYTRVAASLGEGEVWKLRRVSHEEIRRSGLAQPRNETAKTVHQSVN